MILRKIVSSIFREKLRKWLLKFFNKNPESLKAWKKISSSNHDSGTTVKLMWVAESPDGTYILAAGLRQPAADATKFNGRKENKIIILEYLYLKIKVTLSK